MMTLEKSKKSSTTTKTWRLMGTQASQTPQEADSRQSSSLVKQWLLDTSQKGALCLYQHLPLDSRGRDSTSQQTGKFLHAGALIPEAKDSISPTHLHDTLPSPSHLSPSASNYWNSSYRRAASWDQQFPQSGQGRGWGRRKPQQGLLGRSLGIFQQLQVSVMTWAWQLEAKHRETGVHCREFLLVSIYLKIFQRIQRRLVNFKSVRWNLPETRHANLTSKIKIWRWWMETHTSCLWKDTNTGQMPTRVLWEWIKGEGKIEGQPG